jgi:hypothetical protein
MFPTVSGHNPNKDYEVSQPPEDSISKVKADFESFKSLLDCL